MAFYFTKFSIKQSFLKCKTYSFAQFFRSIKYVQGQELNPKEREYFYYINHEGMLFLDDAKIKNFTSCFKERKFLRFFFSRIKLNETGCYEETFPFVSLCGKEKNYIRCDDLPIVFTQLLKDSNGNDVLSYAHVGDQLIIPFRPDKIYMKPETGRVYHPAWPRVGNVGLVRSKLAIELCKYFEFEKGEDKPPTHFTWNDKRLEIDINWVNNTIFNKKDNL